MTSVVESLDELMRHVTVWTTVASTPMLAAVFWYAHLAAVRLPGQPWWRWIAGAFGLAVIRIWLGYMLRWQDLPPWPWSLLEALMLPTICGILVWAFRAASRSAVSQDERARCLSEKLSALRVMLRGE